MRSMGEPHANACRTSSPIGISTSVAVPSQTRSSAIASHESLKNSTRTCSSRSDRSEEHTSELQSLMRISYAVFCLKKKNQTKQSTYNSLHHTRQISLTTHQTTTCKMLTHTTHV